MILLILQIENCLTKPEKLKMVHQERSVGDEQPAEQHETIYECLQKRMFKMPDNNWNGQPVGNQDCQRQAGNQHVGASLYRSWYVLEEPALKTFAGHETMLQAEESYQGNVDENCLPHGANQPS